MKLKRLNTEGLEGQHLEFVKEYNGLVDVVNTLLDKGDSSEEIVKLKSSITKLEERMPEEFKDHTDAIEKIQNEITKLQDDVKKTPKTEEYKTLAKNIEESIKSLGCTNMEEFKKLGKQEFEIKADTIIDSTANSGYIGRTNVDTNPAYAPVRKLAFLPYFRKVTEAYAKSRFTYTEASYTSNAGYVGEGTGPANSDEASAVEKSRDYAKVSAYQHITTETFEDIPAFANTLAAKMEEGAMLFVDKESYSGDGLAPAGVQHMFGIRTTATAFDSASYAGTVEKANLADLVEAIKTQIEVAGEGAYVANAVWVNPVDFFKLRTVKDTTGQPIVRYDFFGNPKLAGLDLVKNTAVTVNTLLVADTSVIELRTKRTMQMKMGQILDGDVLNDRQSAILFARFQTLVRDIDKVATVKVDSISDEIANLEPEV